MKLVMIVKQHWNLFLIGLLEVKCLKNFLLLCTQMIIYFILIKNLVMLDFLGTLNIDLISINLDNHFNEDAPDTVIFGRFLAWYIKFEKRKALKKKISEEFMPVAWHLKRWWNFSMPEDEKKEIEPIFSE